MVVGLDQAQRRAAAERVMRNEGLSSIAYDTHMRCVTVLYRRGATYSLDDIIAYSNDMSDGKATRIVIYEDERKMHDISLRPAQRPNA
jgi:hypothetical protein